MGWTVLDGSFLTSTVLKEGPVVVSVWALLLASADRLGVSTLTPSSAASLLRISEEETQKAFDRLAAPDDKSRSHAEGGRRILPTEEGFWEIVSHAKYRKLASKLTAVDRQRDYERRKARRAFKGAEEGGR